MVNTKAEKIKNQDSSVSYKVTFEAWQKFFFILSKTEFNKFKKQINKLD